MWFRRRSATPLGREDAIQLVKLGLREAKGGRGGLPMSHSVVETINDHGYVIIHKSDLRRSLDAD